MAGPRILVVEDDDAVREGLVDALGLAGYDVMAEENGKTAIDRVRAWILANDPAVYPRIYRVLAEGDEELASAIGAISCSTLVMTGDEDFGTGGDRDQLGKQGGRQPQRKAREHPADQQTAHGRTLRSFGSNVIAGRITPQLRRESQ